MGGEGEEKISFRKVNGKIYKLGLCVAFVFVITFLMFPALTGELKSQYESLNTSHWFVIILITVFNAGDTIGRYLPSYTHFGFKPETIWIGVLGRLALYPVFLVTFMGYL